MQRQTMAMGVGVVLGLVLLGAGCRSTQPAPPTNAPSSPPATNAASASDPLADDLDAAIDDLDAAE